MKTNKKMLAIFFAIAFGMPVVLGIFMGIAFNGGQDVSAFPLVWMYLPATAVMAGALFTKEERTAPDGTGLSLPKVFYVTFVAFTAVMVILLIAGVFLSNLQALIWISYLVYAVSLICLAELLLMKKDRREAYGLRLTRSWKRALAGVGIFVLIYLLICAVSMGITYLMGGDVEAWSLSPYLVSGLFIALPLNLLLSFTAFFGEEYGWRYYLQPVLQERFGMKKGVLLLGILWGLWHVPINLFYYSPSTSIQSILVQLAGCVGMGIFFGWVYLRTQNVWAVTMIHFLNNNLGMLLFNASAAGVEREWADTVVTIVIYLAVYVPFLFTKEYREAGNAEAQGQTVWEAPIPDR